MFFTVFVSISFQSWPLYLRFKGAAFLKDTFSQFCFDIRRYLVCLGPHHPVLASSTRYCTPIFSINNKKKMSISMKNSHFKENSHSIFHQTDYKAHLSSLKSQFDKVLYIGLNISTKHIGI